MKIIMMGDNICHSFAFPSGGVERVWLATLLFIDVICVSRFSSSSSSSSSPSVAVAVAVAKHHQHLPKLLLQLLLLLLLAVKRRMTKKKDETRPFVAVAAATVATVAV